MKIINRQKINDMKNLKDIIYQVINKENILSMKIYKKLEIKENFRKQTIMCGDFLLKKLNQNLYLDPTLSKPNLIQDFQKQALNVGKNIFQVYQILSIQTKKELFFGFIGYKSEKSEVDQNTKLLKITLSPTLTFCPANEILSIVRAVHHCHFSNAFNHSLFGIDINNPIICKHNYEEYSMKHNYENRQYFISQYVNSNTKLLYHWLPMMFPGCIQI